MGETHRLIAAKSPTVLTFNPSFRMMDYVQANVSMPSSLLSRSNMYSCTSSGKRRHDTFMKREKTTQKKWSTKCDLMSESTFSSLVFAVQASLHFCVFKLHNFTIKQSEKIYLFIASAQACSERSLNFSRIMFLLVYTKKERERERNLMNIIKRCVWCVFYILKDFELSVRAPSWNLFSSTSPKFVSLMSLILLEDNNLHSHSRSSLLLLQKGSSFSCFDSLLSPLVDVTDKKK